MKKLILLIFVFLVLVSSAFAVTDADIQSTLVGGWEMENNGDDEAPAGNTMSLAGSPTYVSSCKIGGCYNFTASTTDFLTANDITPYTFGVNISFCAWILTYDVTIVQQTFFAQGNEAGNSDDMFQLILSAASEKPGIFMNADTIGNSIALAPISNYRWYHLCGVKDGTNQYLYVNGTLQDTDARGGTMTDSILNMTIGKVWVENRYATALIDQVILSNQTYGQAEIDHIYNNGDGRDIFSVIPPPETTPPTFVAPTPGDGKSNNTNQTINMSCGDNVNMNYTLWFDTNSDPLTLSLGNTSVRSWFMNISTDGTYYYKGACYNGSNGKLSANSSIRTFILDTTNPVIIINTNNFFNSTNNMSIANQYLNNITINTTFTDNDNIFAILYNITKDGVVYFNFTNTSINEKIHNFSRYLDISLWPSGVYDIEITVADGHTATKISDYGISQSINKITFDTIEGNNIILSSDEAHATTYYKIKDRYEFGFKYLFSSTTRTFKIKSDDGKVYYLPDSKYKGHFIVWNGKNGNWIDFEGVGDKYTVKKISDYEYEITFTDLIPKTELIAKSIGGLNVVTENYQWYRGTYVDNVPLTYSGFTSDLTLNITKDDLFITNVSVILLYNNTDETLSKNDYGSYIIYNVTITIPSVSSDSDIPYAWNVTINQSNNGIYDFLIEGNNTVLNWGLDACINATIPTLNISIKNLSTNEYVDVNLDYVFEFWLPPSLDLFYISGSFTGNNQTFCKYSNETQILANVLFEYSLGSTIFDYFLFETNLTNITKQLTLYTQEGTTQVLFTTLDIDSNPIEDAYIHILKYDIATNTYQTTEVIKTDSQGQALGNIILGTTFYNFFVYYQGTLVYTEQAVRVIETTRTFTINLAGVDWFDDFETTLGVITSLYFNNATHNFVYTWTDPTSAMHQACLSVDVMNRTGKFELNTTCVASTSGTILYNIPVLTAGSTYMATGYLKFDFPMITDVVNWLVPPSSSFFNISKFMGLFIAVLFCISMVMIGLPKPELSLTLLGLGVLICSMFGLWAISIMQVVSIIFLMVVQLYLKKGR